MINTAVSAGIAGYERETGYPRHREVLASCDATSNSVKGMERTLNEVNGGVKVLKWIGGIIALGGGIYSWVHLAGAIR